MLDMIACPDPDCGAPAEITDRCTLGSTDEPVDLVKTFCARRHWFTLPTDRVERYRASEPSKIVRQH
jgi:hypothetical protein